MDNGKKRVGEREGLKFKGIKEGSYSKTGHSRKEGKGNSGVSGVTNNVAAGKRRHHQGFHINCIKKRLNSQKKRRGSQNGKVAAERHRVDTNHVRGTMKSSGRRKEKRQRRITWSGATACLKWPKTEEGESHDVALQKKLVTAELKRSTGGEKLSAATKKKGKKKGPKWGGKRESSQMVGALGRGGVWGTGGCPVGLSKSKYKKHRPGSEKGGAK